jgi:hypothetical protein
MCAEVKEDSMLRAVVGIWALVAVFYASPSIGAQNGVTLHPGETVTLRINHGAVTLVSRTAAKEISDFEADVLRKSQMVDVPPDAKTMPAMGVYDGEMPVEPPSTVPDEISITFRKVPGILRGSSEHSFLTILNGYPAGVRYRAVMHRNGLVTATDVCGVLPRRIGTEHWPYVLDALDLSDFRFESFTEANVPCN